MNPKSLIAIHDWYKFVCKSWWEWDQYTCRGSWLHATDPKTVFRTGFIIKNTTGVTAWNEVHKTTTWCCGTGGQPGGVWEVEKAPGKVVNNKYKAPANYIMKIGSKLGLLFCS